MANATFKITGQTAAGAITANVVDNAAIAASIAGDGAISAGAVLGAAISAALAGVGTLVADVTFASTTWQISAAFNGVGSVSVDWPIAPGLINVSASAAGTDITVTATSTSDLSNGVFGVEWGQGGTYGPSKNIVGQVASQSITIGALDGITTGTWNLRPYTNPYQGDPYNTRVYGAAVTVSIWDISTTLSGVGTIAADATIAGAATAWQISALLDGSGAISVDATVVQPSPTPGVVAGTGSGAGRAFRYYRVPERLPEIKRELERVSRKIKKTTLDISLRRSNEDLKRLLEMLNRLQEQYAQLRYAYEDATRAMLTRAEAEEESEFMDFIARL